MTGPIVMRTFVVDTIGPRLDVLLATTPERAEEVMTLFGERAEAAARANAPWDDRTGDARAGLTAEVFMEDGLITLELYHTVEYGEWLEVIQDGRFAVIMPTLEALGPEAISASAAAVMGLGIPL